MSRIFISYRREDSADVTGRIGDRLRAHFGEDNIFTDVDDIPLGVNFQTHLDNAVSQCDVLLAVIGNNWLTAKHPNGDFRLNDPADFVRIEIESALRRDIPVIPLLVRGVSIPKQNQLPESLDELAFRNAQKIRSDPDFNNDVNRLVKSLVKHLELETSADEKHPQIDEDEIQQLKSLRSELLISKSDHEFKRSKLKLKNYLVQYPSSLEAQILLDQIDKVPELISCAPREVSRSTVIHKLKHNPIWLSITISVIVAVPFLQIVLDPWKVTDPPPTDTDFIPPDMVVIPAGTFMMGSKEGDPDELPVHQVAVPAFEMALNELTWAEWLSCEENLGCKKIKRPEFFSSIFASEQSSHPVVNVDKASVNDYLIWINEKTGLIYRLPSEAEWEYAAKAGSTTHYFWSDTIGQNQANCDGCGSQWDDQSTAPVGAFTSNPFGLSDMHGNVWEWTADCWHGTYDGAPGDGSAWVENCTKSNVIPLRGGSWLDVPRNLRSASRLWNNAVSPSINVGFRLARTLP